MERNLRVRVRPKHRRTFSADRAVAKSGTFGRACDDTDVGWERHVVSGPTPKLNGGPLAGRPL
jgi:hypothetical protein